MRKFGLGAAVLALVTVSLVVPGIDPFALWLGIMALGAVAALGELIRRRFRQRRTGDTILPEAGRR